MRLITSDRRSPPTGVLIALLACLGACGGDPTTAAPPPQDVRRIDDYADALAAARDTGAMLVVSVEPGSGDAAGVVDARLEQPDVRRRFAASETPWVTCRVTGPAAAALAADPALAEMRRGAGVFVVDHAHSEWDGRVVSILPRTPGKYYRFDPSHLDVLATLPAGSLTQRSMVFAVRIHPEAPQSTCGACDAALCREAAAHSHHQAAIRRQGHHGWDVRSQRVIAATGGGGAAEVCAESWENQDLLDSCVDCVASWRQSSGHWGAVRAPQAAFGYDISRGSNGIWYATGVFLSR